MRAWVFLLSLAVALPAFAGPDYAREKAWADEITPFIVVGEPVYLTQKNGHKFLGLYARAAHPKMGVVVVHGMGLNPDWGMIGVLRSKLVDDDYSTLSIQMPVLARDAGYKQYVALFPDAVERLELAVAFLKANGYKRIAIVSHSNGSRMTRAYMAQNPPDVDAWAALSLTRGDTFAGIKAPILDLYGSRDLPHVLKAAARRKASLLNPASRQQVIRGADHFYAGHEGDMVAAVERFLKGLK